MIKIKRNWACLLKSAERKGRATTVYKSEIGNVKQEPKKGTDLSQAAPTKDPHFKVVVVGVVFLAALTITSHSGHSCTIRKVAFVLVSRFKRVWKGRRGLSLQLAFSRPLFPLSATRKNRKPVHLKSLLLLKPQDLDNVLSFPLLKAFLIIISLLNPFGSV